MLNDAQADDNWYLYDDDLESRIAEVNEGVLEFLAKVPEKPVHHHINQIEIIPSSLDDGWVKIEQCHTHLDPVSAMEITYHPRRIRNMQVLSSQNVGAIQIKGASVELTEISSSATLCLQIESKALIRLNEGEYRLRNGPFMRRFLDGYFPMRVTLLIKYSDSLLSISKYRPLPGESGSTIIKPGSIKWDGWFQGRLITEFDFKLKPYTVID